MSIYLIRHGATQANEQRLYCGSTDLPLSDKGRQELLGLHYTLPAAQFISSGMLRATQTLTLLFGNVPFRVDSRFCEVDFGAFEMGSYDQLKNDPAYQAWLTGDNDSNIPPGGESGAQMRQRVLAAFRELLDQSVVVTHGGCIAAIMAELFPEEGKSRYAWQPANGRGYAITQEGYRPIP